MSKYACHQTGHGNFGAIFLYIGYCQNQRNSYGGSIILISDALD